MSSLRKEPITLKPHYSPNISEDIVSKSEAAFHIPERRHCRNKHFHEGLKDPIRALQHSASRISFNDVNSDKIIMHMYQS